MLFDFTLTGATPILFHADDVEAADMLSEWRKDPKNRDHSVSGDDRSPPWTWMTYLHSDGEKVALPGEAIMTALRVAAARITLKGKETFKKQSQSGMMLESEFCDFEGPKGPVLMADLARLRDLPFAEQARRVQDLGFTLFVKRAPIGQAKHVRVRPRFNSWRARGRVEVLDPIITEDVLRQMFEIAGSYAGLLDWRPSSKKSPGPFGKFEAALKRAKHAA